MVRCDTKETIKESSLAETLVFSRIGGIAGNFGTQSLAATIRVLMDEKLSGKQKLALIVKEGKVGLINGFILGILTFLFFGLAIRHSNNKIAALTIALNSSGFGLLLDFWYLCCTLNPHHTQQF